MKTLIKIQNYQEAKILERLNRFVVRLKIKNKTIFGHLNNTGKLGEFIKKGKVGLVLPTQNKGKLKFRLSMVKEDERAFSIIDTLLQMKCFEIALKKQFIPWLKGGKILKRNFKLNGFLIDYLIDYKNRKYYLEAKSAVMKYKNLAMYPDCPSERGAKHILTLLKNPKSSIILFIVGMKNVDAFSPNKKADPKIYEFLLKARKVGVKIKAIQLYFDKKLNRIVLKNGNLPIRF